MRKDMARVIQDKPGIKDLSCYGTKSKKRDLQKLDVEDWPTKERMNRSSRYSMFMIGPLRRFLSSKIGQKWDEIYSEIAEVCDYRNRTQREVLNFMERDGCLVEHDVQMIDGEPHDVRGNPILSNGFYQSFYIHPETKTLEVGKQYLPRQKKKPDLVVKKDAHHQYHKIDGIWYCVEFIPYKEGMAVYDILVNKKPKGAGDQGILSYYWGRLGESSRDARDKLKRRYGAEIMPIRKIQCGKKELKFIKKELEKRGLSLN